MMFLDSDLPPAYLTSIIQGMEKAIDAGKIFELESILSCIENPFKYTAEPNIKGNYHEYLEIGKYSWLRSAIIRFIEALVRKDTFPCTDEIMDRTRHIIIDIIENDDDPTMESEKKNIPKAGSMSYITYCMNTNRGQAMIALMHHALRHDRMRPESERKSEEGKGLFPPGERMDLYREFLTQRLEKEPSPSVQSSFGYFLTYLYYLDKNWVEQMIQSSHLFPATTERTEFWKAHWQGYIGFNHFYNEIYTLLKPHYIKAIESLKTAKKQESERSQYDERLAEHLIIAFRRNIEDIKPDDVILPCFFKSAPMALRSHAIKFVADILKDTKPEKYSIEWQRVKVLWKDRITRTADEELVSFTDWLEYCPENLDEIFTLIQSIIPQLRYGYRADELLNYLNKNAESCAIKTILILNDLFKQNHADRLILFRQELIKEILTKIHKYKDNPQIARGINETVNRLVMMGYYDFMDLLAEQ
jgi:hypothetical protein